LFKADRLTEGAIALVREPHLAHLTTLMPSGSPQTTVVWVDVDDDGGHVYVNTAAGRVKEHNIRRDPRVSLGVLRDYYHYVMVRGNVIDITSDGAVEHYRKLQAKYGQPPTAGPKGGDQRLIVKIKPFNVIERGV
jgi:PPOX class probable F420-dependent enzyme